MVVFCLNLRHRLRILQILFLTIWLLGGGCAGVFQGSLIPVPEDQSQQVLEALRQKETTIRTLRGLFQAAVSGSGIRMLTTSSSSPAWTPRGNARRGW